MWIKSFYLGFFPYIVLYYLVARFVIRVPNVETSIMKYSFGIYVIYYILLRIFLFFYVGLISNCKEYLKIENCTRSRKKGNSKACVNKSCEYHIEHHTYVDTSSDDWSRL